MNARLKHGIGQPLQRLEDRRFLRGRGRFVDDLKPAHTLHGVVLYSPHAHAKILSIDASAARMSPGVHCVLVGSDATEDGLGGLKPLFMPEDMGGPPGFQTVRPLLVTERVRYVGDRVAFVVADSIDMARDALELVQVEYSDLPHTTDPEASTLPDAPRIWDDCSENRSFTLTFGDSAATNKAFEAATHKFGLRVYNNRLVGSPLEPRSAWAEYDEADDSFVLYTTSQCPHSVRTQIADDVFGIPEARIRVVSPDVGGGFGIKADPYPEDGLVMWAARKLQRPVSWTATRTESFLGDNQARDQIVYGEIALNAHGKIVALRSKAYHALGAYIVGAAVAPPMWAARFLPGLYDVEHVYSEAHAVFTNTGTVSVYRGAGRPEAVFLLERLVDTAADKLGIDPVELRKQNFIKPKAFPYTTHSGFVYDIGEFEAVFEKCAKLSNWTGFEDRKRGSEKKSLLRGRGVSTFIELGGVFNERMELKFDASGTLRILAGTHSHGQGHHTAYAQLVSEWLSLPLERIAFAQGDTKEVTFGRGTFAARSSLVGALALKSAADSIIKKASKMAASLMQVSADGVRFDDGTFRAEGSAQSMQLLDVVAAFYAPMGIPAGLDLGLEAVGTFEASPPNFPNGCYICEVEVDPETGKVEIAAFFCVDDCGKIINPMICEGQVHGGVAQGVGQALHEHVRYDEHGQLLTASFMDYGIPRATSLPSLNSDFHELLCKTNELGVKGVGEAGAIGAPPAIINAVVDALRPCGVLDFDMPATPARVWDAIRRAKKNLEELRHADR